MTLENLISAIILAYFLYHKAPARRASSVQGKYISLNGEPGLS